MMPHFMGQDDNLDSSLITSSNSHILRFRINTQSCDATSLSERAADSYSKYSAEVQ